MHHQTSPRPLLLDPNLRVIFAVTLMAMLGVSSVTPAFPQISRALDVSPEAVGWLISAFTVPGVLLAPVFGVAADRFGRRIVLVPSLLVFGLAGAACGFARDFDVLLGLRFLQGVGGAALGPLNVTLIGDLFEGQRRTTAFGYNAGVLSIGTAVYPAIGGALALVAWHVPFFLPIAAVPVAAFAYAVLKYQEPKPQTGLGAYFRNALALIRSPELLLMFTTGVVIFILIYGAYLTFLPFALEQGFGTTSLGIGLVFAAASLATAVAAFLLGSLAKRIPQRRLILTGFVLYVVTMGGIPLAPNLWLVVALAMGFGFANGITVPTVITIVSSTTSVEHRAIIMSVNGMVLRAGQTLGPIIAGAAYAWLGLGAAFWAGAALALGMLGVLGVGRVSSER